MLALNEEIYLWESEVKRSVAYSPPPCVPNSKFLLSACMHTCLHVHLNKATQKVFGNELTTPPVVAEVI